MKRDENYKVCAWCGSDMPEGAPNPNFSENPNFCSEKCYLECYLEWESKVNAAAEEMVKGLPSATELETAFVEAIGRGRDAEK